MSGPHCFGFCTVYVCTVNVEDKAPGPFIRLSFE